MNIVLFGPPGSGKGTQARMIAAQYNIPHISTGDILRQQVEEGSVLGIQVKDIMAKGDFPSDAIILDILKGRLAAADCVNGYLLDGVPRTMNQAVKLDAMLEEAEKSITCAIALDVPDEVLEKRLSGRFTCKMCGEAYNDYFKMTAKEGVCDACHGTQFVRRADDDAASVKNRLSVYYEKTQPVLDFYQHRDRLHSIDGTQPIDVVEKQIESIIKSTTYHKALPKSFHHV